MRLAVRIALVVVGLAASLYGASIPMGGTLGVSARREPVIPAAPQTPMSGEATRISGGTITSEVIYRDGGDGCSASSST